MAEKGIPTEEEIRQLPRWAVVAFAARCARRVQPLLLKHWPDAPEKHLRAIENAITLSENAADTAAARAAAAYAADTAAYATAAADTATADTAAAYATAAADTAAYATAAADTAAARAAANAARAAAYAADTAAADRAADTAAAYANAAARAAARAAYTNAAAIRKDFEHLLQLARTQACDDNTPVPPTVFPPLQEAPKPVEQPLAVTPEELQADVTIKIKVQFLGKPGITAQELAPHIRATYQALNQYTLAKYGKHLRLADFKRLVLQYAGVPA